MDMNIKSEFDKENRAWSIFVFARRVRRMFIYSIFIIILLVFLLVFKPMEKELQKSLINIFLQISHTKFHAIEFSLQSGITGAKSLSSRSVIKSAIGDYYNGKISLAELRALTQPKYEDGAKAIDNIVLAKRFVRGDVIAGYKTGDTEDNDFAVVPFNIKKEQPSEVETRIIVADKSIKAVILSPIIIEKAVVGYDCIVYDLSKQIDILCTNEIEVLIIDDKVYQKLYVDSENIASDQGIELIEKNGSFYALSKIIDGTYIVSAQKQEVLFAPINQLALRIGVGGAVAFFGFVLIIYFYIIRYAKKELDKLELSRNAYRKIAYIDLLTDAYSRQFLEVWNTSVRSSQIKYAIVMIDVDNFKNINDISGHTVGDKVLRQLSVSILETIRQSDLLIRYGGDEFVLILSNIDIEEARYLMKRIEQQLEGTLIHSAPIQISYGISILQGMDNFEEQLKLADGYMYESKKAKKEQMPSS